MVSEKPAIQRLPNEILWSILNPLSTRDLLPLTHINRHFHSAVSRILQRRLIDVAGLPENVLILECYHPSAKISTPYLSCQYMGLKAEDGVTAATPLGQKDNQESISAAELGRMYSSFRPHRTEENRRRRGIWFSRYSIIDNQPRDTDGRDDVATQNISLDEGELFSQLCAVTNVVKEGSRKGLFASHVNVSDGVVRVWRDWLMNQAAGAGSHHDLENLNSEQILWADSAKHIGLRFRVEPGPADVMPLISGPGDDPPVLYTLTYEELIVRTSKLLLAVEQGLCQDFASDSRAIIIAPM